MTSAHRFPAIQVQLRNETKVARILRKEQHLQSDKAVFFEMKSRFLVKLPRQSARKHCCGSISELR